MSNRSHLALASASIFALATSTAFAQMSSETIDEVVVLSSPFKKSSDDIISETHVISSDEIERNSGTTLGDIIKDLPGIDVASHGPEVGRPVIRGLSGRRTGSLVNGMTAGDISDTANDHANIINFFDIDRVELLKGPSALRYGAFATSGVVNSFNRLLDPDAGDAAELSVGGSTVADGSTGAIYGARNFNNIKVSVSGFDQDSEEIKIPTHAESNFELIEEGEEIIDVSQDVENTTNTAEGLSASVIFGGPTTSLALFANTIGKTYGIPGHAHHEEEEEEEEEHEEEGVMIDLDKETFRGVLTGQLASAFTSYEASIHVTNFNQAESEGGAIGTRFGRDIQEAKFELLNDDILGWRGLVGVTIVDNELSTSGDEAFLPNSEHEAHSLHIIQAKSSGDWSTELGVRFDDIRMNGNSVARNFETYNLSAGLGRQISENTFIGGSISASERAPSISELYSAGYHAAASRHERGDTTLSTEESLGTEIYYRYSNGPRAIRLAAFNNDFEDFIYLQGAGIQIEENDVYDYLQNDAEIYGFEASFAQTGTYRGAAWSAEISYSDITGELDNGDPLRSIPTEKIGLFGKLDYDHLSMGLDVIFADDQSDVPTDQHPTDGYIEVSADLLWRPTFSPGTSVAFGIDNLLNQEIRHHTSELKDKVPEAGRNFKILITQSF